MDRTDVRESVPPVRSALPIVFFLATVLAGCNYSRTYEVQGRIAGFGDDLRTLIIEHEDVPGLMPAMVMSFKARSAKELENLEEGDAISFSLTLNRDSSWISSITKLPDDAIAAHPASANMPDLEIPAGTPVLQEGDPVPPFELIDQKGDTLRSTDFSEGALLLTFIYTRCPLPDFCPLMSQNFARLQPPIREQYGDAVQMLSISFDPGYDTPEVLAEYAKRYTNDTRQWRFATGSPEQIGTVATLFGVFYEPEGDIINHSLSTVLIGPEGRVRKIWRGNRWTTQEIMAEIARALDERYAPAS